MKEKHTYHHVDTSDQLPGVLRANPYTVPNGYFESLHSFTIQKSKNADSPLSTFGVPAGYFEQLGDNITVKIAELELKAVVKNPGFSVPENYFNLLEQRLLAYSKISEHAAEPGFTAPEPYFETLSNRILERTTYQAVTPIRKFTRPKWMAYAAAASVALALGLFAILRFTNETVEATSPLASVSDQQIIDYLELYGTADDMMMYISEQLDDFDEQHIGKGVSEEDIEAYLNHTL